MLQGCQWFHENIEVNYRLEGAIWSDIYSILTFYLSFNQLSNMSLDLI